MHQQQTHESAVQQTAIMASASLYYLLQAIQRTIQQNAPPWELVPPLLFGIAAIWNAHTNHKRHKGTAKA